MVERWALYYMQRGRDPGWTWSRVVGRWTTGSAEIEVRIDNSLERILLWGDEIADILEIERDA